MRKLEKALDIDNLVIDYDATHPHTGERVKDAFCGHWEGSKKGLELMGAAFQKPILTLIIFLLLKLGDALSKKLCSEDQVPAVPELEK